MPEFDVIIVGARCAGAPTAMLLAQKGHRVLLLERDAVPSNMAHSTHLIHPMGVAYLQAWGLLDAIEALGLKEGEDGFFTVCFGPVTLGNITPDGTFQRPKRKTRRAKPVRG